jgi:hypothetical protein
MKFLSADSPHCHAVQVGIYRTNLSVIGRTEPCRPQVARPAPHSQGQVEKVLTDAGHDPTAQGQARPHEHQPAGKAPPWRPAGAHSCSDVGASGCHGSAVGAGDGRGAAARLRCDGAQVAAGGLRPHRSCPGGRRGGHRVRHLQVRRGCGGRHRSVPRPRWWDRHWIQEGND